MVIRALIAVQLVWVGLLGLIARGIFPTGPALEWAEVAVVPLFPLAFVAFPVLVTLALRRAGLPPWKCSAVVGIEVMLCVASVVAVLPAVQ
jgi:hypothetical protein